jgi:hypothetical protein
MVGGVRERSFSNDPLNRYKKTVAKSNSGTINKYQLTKIIILNEYIFTLSLQKTYSTVGWLNLNISGILLPPNSQRSQKISGHNR